MAYTLRKGTTRDIVDSNIKTLCECGHSEADATRIALRHSRKRSNPDAVAGKVAAKPKTARVRIA